MRFPATELKALPPHPFRQVTELSTNQQKFFSFATGATLLVPRLWPGMGVGCSDRRFG
jgi:hypothetical protein